ncbi:hypothetical protein [Fredinandcohnia sp. FSL W7-1320]|uniref:hypothetical protein n=1 Tax=Fredinandcohnia sp. FSL W7-1320 TaxID=2954540 RepID=UPI0030FD92E3
MRYVMEYSVGFTKEKWSGNEIYIIPEPMLNGNLRMIFSQIRSLVSIKDPINRVRKATTL